MDPIISFIIVNYNTCDLLAQCLNSIREKVTGISYEIIVVDNASSDGSSYMLKSIFSEVRLLQNNKNTGFGHANNLGVSISKGKYVLLINSDAVLQEDIATPLAAFLESHPHVGAVGPNVFLPNGTKQSKICGFMPSLIKLIMDSLLLSTVFSKASSFNGVYLENPTKGQTPVGWISGVCMLIRKQAYDQVNGFDISYFLYMEDIDLCRRLTLMGWNIFHLNEYNITHHCGASSPSDKARLRNNILQQRHFLIFISTFFSQMEYATAKWIIGTGLLIRLVISVLAHVTGIRTNRFLIRSSSARLLDLMNLYSKPSGGNVENRN